MLHALDLLVFAAYLAGAAALGLWAGRDRSGSAEDYLLGGRSLPWWAVSLSIVATETSTLTVIGIPAVAYGGALTFLQVAFGYLLGRVVVAYTLLPRYFEGDLVTAYELLGRRFGARMRGLASLAFMATRVLGDGVRLFATAVPLRVIALALGVDVSYPALIAGIAVLTLLYTWAGGLKAVVWVDVAQFALYIAGALITIGAAALLTPDLGARFAEAGAAGKLRLIDLGTGPWAARLAQPYALPVAVLGGAVFSMASHGTDQLIVQRLLACRSLAESRRALVWSGAGVVVQFALFLGVGLALWAHYGGAAPEALGLSRADEVFPLFIVDRLPAGVRGLLLAGIVAAAMSTLSSSLSALASSTVSDLLGRLQRGASPSSGASALRASRWATLGWGVVLAGFALLIRGTESAVVELGLGIAGFTYGPLLGAFALALTSRRATQTAAVGAFAVALVAMGLLISGLWYADGVGEWVWRLGPSDEVRAELGLRALAWPLYPAVGAALALLAGHAVAAWGSARKAQT